MSLPSSELGRRAGGEGRPQLGFARSEVSQHKTARQTDRIGDRSRVVVTNAG
jgi:hypothetical protein